MEEAAQILEIETFIPLLLQVTLFLLTLKTLTYDVQAVVQTTGFPRCVKK